MLFLIFYHISPCCAIAAGRFLSDFCIYKSDFFLDKPIYRCYNYNMKKRCFFSALLLTLVLLVVLVSCGGERPSNNNDDSKKNPGPSGDALITLVGAGASDWRIVLPRSADKAEREAAELLQSKISELCGVRLEIGDDYVNAKRGVLPAEHEIIVGDTSRDESRAVGRRIRSGDSEVAVEGGKLVILGGSYELTLDAARRLCESLSATADRSLAIDSSQCTRQEDEYAINTLTVDGVSLMGLDIVYPAGNSEVKKIGEQLAAHLSAIAGLRTSCVSGNGDATAGIVLSVGEGNEVSVTAEGGSVYIKGGDVCALRYAVSELCGLHLAESAAKDGAIAATFAGKTIKNDQPTQSIMSFNILCDLKGEISRADKVIATVRERMPDSVGFQEVTEQWLSLLVAGLGDKYDWVGEINVEQGQRWRNAIFYRRDKYELVSTETRWLSGTPSRESKLDASSQYRIYTTARLRCIESGQEFVHVNTHLSYEEAARRPQVNILLRALAKLDVPFALTGDFNFTPSTQYYPMILAGGFEDSKYLTADRDDKNTCEVNIIDYCYLSEGDYNVHCYRVEDRVVCSDHRAVYVEFSLLYPIPKSVASE